MDIPKLLESASTFLQGLRWTHVAQIAALVLIAGSAVLFWINKDYISGAVKPATFSLDRPPLIISDNAKASIDDTLKKASFLINTISVVSVNMEQNTRRVIYFVTNDIEIERQNAEFVRTHATIDVPLFDDDAENNRRLIRLINGEIVCLAYKDAVAARYLKNVNVKYACSVGIPPYYGRFRGTILVLLKVVPDAEEQTRLRILMRELSHRLDNPSSGR